MIRTENLGGSGKTSPNQSLENWSDWLDAWCANGDLHAGLALEAEARGRNLTAGQAWMRAALSYHFAKFVWVLDMEKHREATTKSVDAMRRAHKFLDPKAERIHIPFEGRRLVGNLQHPAKGHRPGLVILLPGLDSTKEEFYNWEEMSFFSEEWRHLPSTLVPARKRKRKI